MALIGLLFAVFFLPVLVLAGLGYWLARGRVTRREAIVIAAISAIGVVVDLSSVVGGYATWIGSFTPGSHASSWDVPVVPLLLLGTLAAAGALLVASTAVGSQALNRVMKGKASSLTSDSLLPDPKRRDKIGTVVAPPSTMVVRIPGHEGAKSGSQFLLGYGRDNRPVYLSSDEIGTHMIIMGTTGSGKTETLKNIMGGLADVGWDVTVVDLKEDTKPGGLRDFMVNYARHHTLPYQELAISSTDGSFWFDPVAGLGRDETRDTILSLTQFDDAHWQAMSKNLLGQAVGLLWMSHEIDPVNFKAPTMRDIYTLLQDGATLPAKTKKMRAALVSRLAGYNDDDYSAMKNPNQIEQQAAGTFAAKLQQIYVTDAGQKLLSPRPGMARLDVTRPGFTYIGLDSNGKADLSMIVSSSVLQRMNVYVSERNTGKSQQRGQVKPRVLIIDEAGNVARDIVINLLERARSANIAVILSTQSPMSWRQGEDDWARITNNTNVAIIMRQGNPDEAETLAEYLGKRQQYTVSQRVSEGEIGDGGSAKLEYDYHVHPEEIRSLAKGEAILRAGTTQRVEYVKVALRQAES